MAAHQHALTSYLSDLDRTPDLERLVRPHLVQVRDWFYEAAKAHDESTIWVAVGNALDARFDNDGARHGTCLSEADTCSRLRSLTSAQARATEALLTKIDNTETYAKQFQSIVARIYDCNPTWAVALGPERASFWEYALMTWLSALFGVNTKQSAKVIVANLFVNQRELFGHSKIVSEELSLVERRANNNNPRGPVTGPIKQRPRAVTTFEVLAQATPTQRNRTARRMQGVGRRVKRRWWAWMEYLAETPQSAPDQTSTDRNNLAQANRPQRPIAPIPSRDESAPKPVATRPQSSATLRTVNGKALHSSVLGTWVKLVMLSWVSLVWGALITLPLGVGIGILATFFVGMVAVPLWGTVFGLLGMQGARDSTLSSMKFAELPPDSPFVEANNTFAAQLDIQPPQIGTVDVYNAFAMGTHRDKATIALGKPLLDTLTEDEARAVLGHELGHVVSGDMRRMMLMRTFQNACVWYMAVQRLKHFARWVISWVGELYILSFSRNREYWADAIGAALTSKEAMIGALKKLEAGPGLTDDEHLNARFMCRGRSETLLSTHPTTDDRIAALEAETYLKRLPLR